MVVPNIESELDNRPSLPRIFPSDEKIEVEGERKTYNTFVGIQNDSNEQFEYVLDKAPVTRIESVSGRDRDGISRTFTNGTDYVLADKVDERVDSFTFRQTRDTYELTNEPDSGTLTIIDENSDTYTDGVEFDLVNPDGAASDTIVWDLTADTPDTGDDFTAEYVVTFPDSVVQFQEDANNLPEPERDFFVTYTAESILSRFLDSTEEQFDATERGVREVINKKFINTAEGESLDRLGELFGPVIGDRAGRDDQEYRILLRSIVQSFVSRGTVNGIKLAVSASVDVPFEDIAIREDFQNNSYEVVIQPNEPFTGSIVEDVAEIADPSGVFNAGTVIDVPEEQVSIIDIGELVEPINLEEQVSIIDIGELVEPIKTDETPFFNDVLEIPAASVVNETVNSVDSARLPPAETASEEQRLDDNTAVQERESGKALWENQSRNQTTEWNFFEWTTLEEVFRQNISDSASIDDSVIINAPPDVLISDSSVSDDEIVFETSSDSPIKEQSTTTDNTVINKSSDNPVNETLASTDSPEKIENTVAWGAANWEVFEWAKESN